MEENPEDVAVDTNTDVEEATNSNEDSDEDTVSTEEELERQRKANAQILARAKRAEEELRKVKSKQPEAPRINNDNQLEDELRLIARGYSDDEISKLKVVAKGSEKSLLEATKDPLFLTFQNDLKERERRENARLGASKGSGESQENTLIKKGMTREEHLEAFKKLNN